MNHKQKLGYMALGAGIMALGIIIGQFVTPDIEAQNNGVFDEITCSKLTVVNDAGTCKIELVSGEDMNMIRLADKAGNPQIGISVSEEGNSMIITNKRNHGIGIWLISDKEKDNQIILYNPDDNANNNQQIALRSHDGHSLMTLGHTERDDDRGITLFSSKKQANMLTIADDGRGAAILIKHNETGNIMWSAP